MILMLCVNDHRNGMFKGICSSISLDDCERLTLESPYVDRSLKCAITGDSIRLGRSRVWSHLGETEWVGNWCWNAVKVNPFVAADILNFVIGKGYRWNVASEDLARKIDQGCLLTAEDISEE